MIALLVEHKPLDRGPLTEDERLELEEYLNQKDIQVLKVKPNSSAHLLELCRKKGNRNEVILIFLTVWNRNEPVLFSDPDEILVDVIKNNYRVITFTPTGIDQMISVEPE